MSKFSLLLLVTVVAAQRYSHKTVYISSPYQSSHLQKMPSIQPFIWPGMYPGLQSQAMKKPSMRRPSMKSSSSMKRPSMTRPRDREPRGMDVLEVAESLNFNTLVENVELAMLTETLKGSGPFTVFAPSDNTFQEFLPPGLLDKLPPGELEAVLLRHVIPAMVMENDIDGGVVTTAGGEDIMVMRDPGGQLTVMSEGGISNILQTDISASNGVIHVVDGVFFDRKKGMDVLEVAESLDFNTLVENVELTNLTETLKGSGPFTVFAPSDNTFTEFLPPGLRGQLPPGELEAVLLRHVIPAKVNANDIEEGPLTTASGEDITIMRNPDGSLMIESEGGISNVLQTDVTALNGVIHVVDGVFFDRNKFSNLDVRNRT